VEEQRAEIMLARGVRWVAMGLMALGLVVGTLAGCGSSNTHPRGSDTASPPATSPPVTPQETSPPTVESPTVEALPDARTDVVVKGIKAGELGRYVDYTVTNHFGVHMDYLITFYGYNAAGVRVEEILASANNVAPMETVQSSESDATVTNASVVRVTVGTADNTETTPGG
jgi:hypothetical protein